MNPLDPTGDEFLEAGTASGQPSPCGSRPVPTGVADLYRDVESSLRRSFPVPDLSTLIGRVEAAAAQVQRGGRDAIEGTIRWLAAAAALLFMCMTVCVSTLLAPVSERAAGESMRGWSSSPGWSSSLLEAVGMGLSTASALVASGVALRRGRDVRMGSQRFGRGVALPPGSGSTSPVEWVEPSVTRLLAPATAPPGRGSRPVRTDPVRPDQSIDDRRYLRRELHSVRTSDDPVDGGRVAGIPGCREFAGSWRGGWGTASLAA